MAKPWKVRTLNPDDSLKRGLKKILLSKFREMVSYVPAAIEGSNIEALHDLRISTRRLESTLKIFRKSFPRQLYKEEYKTIKGHLRTMGKVRELDILLQTIRQFSETIPLAQRQPIEMFLIEQSKQHAKARQQLFIALKELSDEQYRTRFEQFTGRIGEQ